MSADGQTSAQVKAALIGSVGVTIEAYLGGARLTIAELNALGPDKVVALGVLNAPVELRVNGLTIAHGELVAVDDNFGVRITAMASP